MAAGFQNSFQTPKEREVSEDDARSSHLSAPRKGLPSQLRFTYCLLVFARNRIRKALRAFCTSTSDIGRRVAEK